jgi:alpha-1,6-mannosyltransferase
VEDDKGGSLRTGLLVVIGVMMELCFLTFYCVSTGPGEVLLFIAVNVATFLLLSFLLWRLRKGHASAGRRWVMLIAGFALLFRLTLVPHGVIGSDDIYRYLWDGKVAAAGVNPFAYTPTDPHLSGLATADLPSKVNHPELRSVYPALAQLLFLLAHVLFGDSLWGIKLILTALDCLTMFFIWRSVRERENPVIPLLLYAWCPLPILYFALDGHIDALGIPFLVLGLSFLSTRRSVRGAVAIGMSALAKLIPLLVLPLLVRELRGSRRFLIPAIPVLMVLAGAFFFYEPSWGVVESLTTFGSRWEFNGSIFSITYFLTGSNEAAHIVSGVLIALYIGTLALIDRPLLEKVFWGFVGFILLSPVVHPWYLTWLAALLPLRWSPGVFVFLGMSALANVVVYQYRSYGVWIDQPVILVGEYLPVVVLLVREILRGEVLPSSGRSAVS